MNEFRQEYIPSLSQSLLTPLLENGAVILFFII